MPSATRYEDLARAITDAYPALPNRLQVIARFALGNPDAMALSTVAEIARGASVPPSAVIRFAKALGYDGFSTSRASTARGWSSAPAATGSASRRCGARAATAGRCCRR